MAGKGLPSMEATIVFFVFLGSVVHLRDLGEGKEVLEGNRGKFKNASAGTDPNIA